MLLVISREPYGAAGAPCHGSMRHADNLLPFRDHQQPLIDRRPTGVAVGEPIGSGIDG